MPFQLAASPFAARQSGRRSSLPLLLPQHLAAPPPCCRAALVLLLYRLARPVAASVHAWHTWPSPSRSPLLDGLAGARSLDGFEEQLEASTAPLRGGRKEATLRRAGGGAGAGAGAGGGGGALLQREGGGARPSASHNPFSFNNVTNKTVLLSRKSNSYARRRWLHANSLRAYVDKAL